MQGTLFFAGGGELIESVAQVELDDFNAALHLHLLALAVTGTNEVFEGDDGGHGNQGFGARDSGLEL